jgi:four helix bundle protein
MQYERKEQTYEDLAQRTKRYALQIIRLCASLPTTMEAQVLGKQLLRSGTSVGANYREAFTVRHHEHALTQSFWQSLASAYRKLKKAHIG